jgi:endonuclease III-like uncharacterized protein
VEHANYAPLVKTFGRERWFPGKQTFRACKILSGFQHKNAVLVERMNEKNAERLLENLKLVSEATP